MNTVINSIKPQETQPQQGGLYEDTNDGEVFVLSHIQGGWAAISIASGGAFRSVKNTATEAVAGLLFIGDNLKITISK